LDEALSMLPEKYRLPFVLCHLEERSHEEAAELLRVPKRTVTGRLEKARELLRHQLSKRGVVLATGIFASLAVTQTASAALPATTLPSPTTPTQIHRQNPASPSIPARPTRGPRSTIWSGKASASSPSTNSTGAPGRTSASPSPCA